MLRALRGGRSEADKVRRAGVRNGTRGAAARPVGQAAARRAAIGAWERRDHGPIVDARDLSASVKEALHERAPGPPRGPGPSANGIINESNDFFRTRSRSMRSIMRVWGTGDL